jgi:predicted  nucleic acid-binding Zn-ribbon protein
VNREKCYHNAEMTVEIEQVTRLQSLDLRIAELEREVATLPKHIAQIEKALDSHLRRLEADRAALVANQKERKQLEDDVKVENQKDLQTSRPDAGRQNQRAIPRVPA